MGLNMFKNVTATATATINIKKITTKSDKTYDFLILDREKNQFKRFFQKMENFHAQKMMCIFHMEYLKVMK